MAWFVIINHTMITLTQDPSSQLSFFAPRSGGVWGGQSYWDGTASSWSGDHFCQERRRADMRWGRRDRGNRIGGRCSWCTQCQESLEESISVWECYCWCWWRKDFGDTGDYCGHWPVQWTPHPHQTLAPARRSSHPHTAMQWKYNL